MNKLRVFFSNTRSVRNKIELLNAKLIEFNIDIVLLNETWLSAEFPDNLISIHYNFFRKERKGRGGGVLIGIKKCYKSIEIKVLNNDFEEV